MTKRLIYLAGVPASGKSTLFRRLRKEFFTESKEFSHGLLRGIQSGNLFMLGVFDGSTFEGTDRLSMSVINDALDWFKHQNESALVLVEGDRLFNERFLSETGANVVLIDAHPSVLASRHRLRGDNQTERFLRSRRTKVENFAKKFRVQRHYNDTPSDAERIYNAIKQEIVRWNSTTR